MSSQFRGGLEPDLDSLLDDPLTQMMMEKDGVDEGELRDIIEQVRFESLNHRAH